VSDPDGPIEVRLTYAEAHALLLLIERGSDLMRPSTRAAAERFRAVLLASGFDADLDDARPAERSRHFGSP